MPQVTKTQLLITDVDSKQFSEGWPLELKQKLFKDQFKDIEPEFYSPLPFLHRIVIILKTEDEAKRVYEYLVKHVRGQDSTCFKVYLTESLISRPRSKSFDDRNAAAAGDGAQFEPHSAEPISDATSRADQGNDSLEYADHLNRGALGSSNRSCSDSEGSTRPVLKVNTSWNSSTEGVGISCSRDSISSPSSLSPEQPLSPTKVKLRDDQEEYFYMEPAPARATSPSATQTPINNPHTASISVSDASNEGPSVTHDTKESRPSPHPRSPSITITSMF